MLLSRNSKIAIFTRNMLIKFKITYYLYNDQNESKGFKFNKKKIKIKTMNIETIEYNCRILSLKNNAGFFILCIFFIF